MVLFVSFAVLLPHPGKGPVQAVEEIVPLAVPHGDTKGGVDKPELTRHALELIDAYQCGVAVATKSDLIVRDMDLYRMIQDHSPVICKVTVTTTGSPGRGS